MKAWLPNGKLKDGTLLFGPLKEKPENDLGRHIEFQIKGKTWFVVHSGHEPLSDEQTLEVKRWAKKILAERER